MKSKNESILSETQKFADARYLIFADYRGLNVSEISLLRRELKHRAVEFRVIKNTLSSILFKKFGIEGIDAYLTGPTAIAFCMQDEIAPSRLLANFAKEHEGLKIKGGLLNKKLLDASAIESIAKLPGREALLSKLLTVMQFPILKLVCLFEEPIRELLSVLLQRRKKGDR
ncbi:50S ribosomal protein L10 [Candidatus Desantisbacteria bacterium CG1_02_38_46]|uniref:Large ribosomal subunit protein uL10 n=3 Tax=unclassified Candidatus Desantisiibacteriota TaxID=3106372 RepID=A0A2H9PCI2_9BACT|nr:MAG: 50S ribosomal protein L10 [Candidatus Desantisbacteria bacterium CG1_02_38_46]PIU51308.1 MAG: 50S ribosomal protein L10 [Candidatus Desantisbacteria bacterium CG07_land_8_20_14_0_80_39_15]PIZ16932.1 MAG: 50S ribosomal protein L10 [Candidatus Desantisbacteria bacterium CG_4_10_14_0_8_um_filter_39_17]